MIQGSTDSPLVSLTELARTAAFVERESMANWQNSGAPISAGRPLARVISRERSKSDRYNPRAEQAAVLDIQARLINAESKLNSFAGEPNKANWNEAAQELDDLDRSLNPGQDPLTIPISGTERKERIKEFLADRNQDQATVDRLAEVFWKHNTDSASDRQARQQANLEIIAAYKRLLRDQVNLARFYSWDGNFKAKNFAPGYLRAALEQSAELFNELNWHRLRYAAAGKTREISTVDFLGRTTWATSLDGLDIQVTKNENPTTEDQEYTTTIRRGLWLHPHSRIAIIVNDFIKSDAKDRSAVLTERLDELISLYPREQSLFELGETSEIREALTGLKQYVTSNKNKSHKEELQDRVKFLQDLIPEGFYKYTRRNIDHPKDSRSGTRSIIHTLEGNIKDYQEVSMHLASIEQVAHMLKTAARKKHLSARNLEEAVKLISAALEWAKIPQARVPERTNARTKLETFVNDLNAANQLQASDKEVAAMEYSKLARRLSKSPRTKEDLVQRITPIARAAVGRIDNVAALLNNRLVSIANINQRTKDRLDSLLVDMRDSELCGNARRLANLFKEAKYQEVKEILEEMNSLYLRFNTPEHGFKRAQASFADLYQINNSALNSNLSTQDSEKFEHLCQLIVADIQNKMKYRVLTIDVDKGSKAVREYRFVEPQDLSRKSLTRQLGFEYIKEGLAPGLNGTNSRTKFRHWQDAEISEELLTDTPPLTFFLSRLPQEQRSKITAPSINLRKSPLINLT